MDGKRTNALHTAERGENGGEEVGFLRLPGRVSPRVRMVRWERRCRQIVGVV